MWHFDVFVEKDYSSRWAGLGFLAEQNLLLLFNNIYQVDTHIDSLISNLFRKWKFYIESAI